MNLHILVSAFGDLADGRDFYKRQGEGLGGFFLDSLFSDIDSLVLYDGIHRKVFLFSPTALQKVSLRHLLPD